METKAVLNEQEAIAIAKGSLKLVNGENWTISYMNESDVDDFIWGFLFDNGLQYLKPISYSNGQVALCHQELN